jgi:ornithine carbamoyltransferase
MRHLLSIADLDRAQLYGLLETAGRFKAEPPSARLPHAHAAALLFERPSLRTRAAYEVALMHLGGRAVTFETELGQRETVADIARTLSHLVSLIVARVRDHSRLEELAGSASVPVVNALSNREHPVEVLADALTLWELWGEFRGRRLAYLGDGNNICHSLLLMAPLLGADIAVAYPPGFAPAQGVIEKARALAVEHGTQVHVGTEPGPAASGADALYTDVWASMGQEHGTEKRRQVFLPFQVNRQLLGLAQADAVVLHCLPARRGEEITADVLDGPRSLAFGRLANLVPVTTAVLHTMLPGKRN